MEKDIEIEGLRVHYTETGDPKAEPVVILHGWGCNHTTVRSIASYLEDVKRVFCVDLPGHGLSDEPQEVWGTSEFSGLIGKFINTLGLQNPSLVGHSFGGRTSIHYATENGIKKLVLVDSAGITPRRSLRYYWKVYTYKATKKILMWLYGEGKGKEKIEKAIKKKGSADYQAASPMMRAIMSKCVNEDLKHLLPEIKAPTLLIWGENDTATPLGDAKIMEKGIPDAGLVSFPGCGHYSFLDNPYQFRAVIRSFFEMD